MDYLAFADDWVAAWNSHDLDRILSHYADDIRFRSHKALAITGNGEVVGKAALYDYWAAALASVPDLKFTLKGVFAGHETVTIHYINQHGIEATETIAFGPDGLATFSAACYADQSR